MNSSVFQKFFLGKMLGKRKWVGVTIVLKFFCLTVSKRFVGKPSSFQKKSGSEIFMHKGGRGIRILRKTVLFHSTERFCQGSLLCLRKLSIPKNVKNKKRGGHQDPRQCFWLTVLTHFVGEHFSVSANFYIEIFRAQEGEVYHDFPLKFFLSAEVSQYRNIS